MNIIGTEININQVNWVGKDKDIQKMIAMEKYESIMDNAKKVVGIRLWKALKV